MKFLSRALLSLVLLAGVMLLGTPALDAQATRGSIAGVVSDESGDTTLPGALVTMTHRPTGTRYTAVSDSAGRFRVQNVRVGPYVVSVEMEGFEPAQKDDVTVSLGGDTFVNFGLQLAGMTEMMTVIGESDPIINPTRTGAASNVSTQSIETLPSIGRGLEDFARTNPFFVVQSQEQDPDNISIAGRNARYNNIQIDGAVNNDLFGLADQGTPGGQANTTPISLDAVAEVQLILADFDVRQGGFASGAVNAITRSGSNEFKGSAYYFTRDDGLVGDGPEELGEFGDFSEDNYGFRIGGPIQRERIFFFGNFDINESERPTGWSIDGSGGQTFANGGAIDEANRFRDILINQYGFDPGGLGQRVNDNPSDKVFVRFDFNLSESHQLTLRHNYVDASNDINRPGSFTYEWPSESYTITNETNSTVGQLNSVLSSTMFNELRLNFSTIKDRRGGSDGVRFPWVEVENVIDSVTGVDYGEFEAGTEPFSTRNSLDQDILEITNDFTWLKGDHTITLGTHNELFSFDNLFIQNAFGSYEFTDLDDFEAGIVRRYQFTSVNPGQAASQKFDVNQLGFYAGDVWAFKPNVTLTYGLRIDIPYFPDTPSRNPITEQVFGFRTDAIPDGNELVQPRFGFNWDLQGDGQKQLRGGLGIFAGRSPYVWISNNYARTGIEQTNLTLESRFVGPIPFVTDPDAQPPQVGGGIAAVGEFNLIDPDFQFPTVWRFNLGYDQQLPWWGLIGTAEVVISESIDEIDYQNLNVVPTGATLPFDGRPVMQTLDPTIDGAYLIKNTGKGENTNFAIKVERPYRRGVYGFASYAYGESKVVNDGTSSRAVSNWQFTEAIDPNNVPLSTSDFEVEHRFNASVSYTTDWGGTGWDTTVSAFYNAMSGRPISFLVGDAAFPFESINEDNFGFNDLMYVPAGPNDVIISNGTWDQLDAFIRSDDCLNSHRGSIAPRNCSNAPWIHEMDLRIAQDIPLPGGTSFQLTLDIANLANMLDDDSGQLRFVPFGTATPVEYVGLDQATGLPIYELQRIVTSPDADLFETHNIRSRWRAKLGARFTF